MSEKKFVPQGYKTNGFENNREDFLFWKKLWEDSLCGIPRGMEPLNRDNPLHKKLKFFMQRYSREIINPWKVFGKEKENENN